MASQVVGRGGGKGGWDYRWEKNTLLPNLVTFTVKVEAATAVLVERMAEKVEAYAKENAPWEDDTGQARRGLTAKYSFNGGHHTISLYHTVDYGIWLEIKNSGEYAIILPTIEVMGPRIMREIQTGLLVGMTVSRFL